MKFEWQAIHILEEKNSWSNITFRARVPGGWLVRHSGLNTIVGGHKFGMSSESSMIFVSDPRHDWSIE